MHNNSIAAYEKLDLPKAERETVTWLAKYGPASQAVLIQNILREIRFIDWEDAKRVKFGQNLYARLHGLKAKGYAVITGTEPDPYTGNTVDVYALNPTPAAPEPKPTKTSAKAILTKLDALEEHLDLYPDDSTITIKSFRALLRKVREP